MKIPIKLFYHFRKIMSNYEFIVKGNYLIFQVNYYLDYYLLQFKS